MHWMEDRAEEFAPVKNADGEDSPEAAKRALARLWAGWLEAAGAKVKRNGGGDAQGKRRRGRFSAGYTWAMLMARIYEVLPLVCARCGSAMTIIAFITDQDSITRILEHIGEPSSPPAVSPARCQDPFPYDQGPDPPAD